MAEEKQSGRIKDRILDKSGAKADKVKKKIVIKKKTAPKSKNITDLYKKKKVAKKTTAPVKKTKSDDKSKKTTVAPKKTVTEKPVSKAKDLKDQASVNQAGIPTRGTPFDAALEGAKKPTSAQGRKQQHKKPAANEAPVGRRKSKEVESANKFFTRAEKKKKQPAPKGSSVPRQIEIMESIQVGELAKKLNLKASEVIARLMKMGEMVVINKIIDAETASLVAGEYSCEVKVVSLYDETLIEDEDDSQEKRHNRPPVVTIMGHVDHGKTKLLDTIRNTNIIDTEAGAITQHIGAYKVVIPKGEITFLDTPGHEAFTAMRARGAALTDIVILVVAADDGVKEQTIEAANHAKEAGVPIIVAINKIDLETANSERVKQELSRLSLAPEDWGGSTIFCEISAKEGTGIENLLEMIIIQSEMMVLKANPDLRAVGNVVEARVDPGRGPVATLLIQKGTLNIGDPYVVGIFSGRVRTILNDRGQRIESASPSTPVEITGINGVPQAGDPFQVVSSEKYGREVASKRQHYQHINEAAERSTPSLGDLKNWIVEQEVKELKIIIKADVQGSIEAIRDGLIKLSTDDVKVRVIHGATGAISESDVDLAKTSGALIIGFHIRPTSRAESLATQYRVEIKFYNVIYDIIKDVHNALEGMLEPDIVEEVTGRAEIREIFRISRIGNVAGCMMLSGKISRNNKIRIIRDGAVIFTGELSSLRRHKDDVNEVLEGFECGMSVAGYNDLKVNDQLEGFELRSVARQL